jgi:hypothetical protein
MTNEERTNILDQHKTIYDGYVTEYAQGENKQPLYVQDYANDKGGITVNNKGEVKPYGNVGINESIDGRLDMIGDGDDDLINGTVDFSSIDKETNHDYHHDRYPSPGEDEDVYISLGMVDDEEYEPMYHHEDSRSKDMLDKIKYDRLSRYNGGDFDIELDEVDDTILDLKPEWSDDEEIVNDIYDDGFDEVDEEEKDEFLNKLNESLDMFRRFKKYN